MRNYKASRDIQQTATIQNQNNERRAGATMFFNVFQAAKPIMKTCPVPLCVIKALILVVHVHTYLRTCLAPSAGCTGENSRSAVVQHLENLH